MKIIRNNNDVIVVFDSGMVLQGVCNDTLFNQIIAATTEQEIIDLMPSISKEAKEKQETDALFKQVENSQYLTKKNESIYWEEVSGLSLPKDFVLAVLKAEQENNQDAIEGYKNFWTLMSLNPDSRCRENLWWYLTQWGFKISKSGLFVGYRNVDIFDEDKSYWYSQSLCDFVKENYNKVKAQKQSPKHYWIQILSKDDYYLLNDKNKSFDEFDNEELLNLDELYNEFKAVNFVAKNCGNDTIYTDAHSHTFRIKVGEMVTMPREKCDSVQEHQCSKGLHIANAEWLKEGYYGTQGLVCLVNPRDTVAVPYDSQYGKLRTCAYLPIALVEYDELGNVIPYNVEDGFESKWVKTLLYDGERSTEENAMYTIGIPDIPEINKSTITEAVLNIARKNIKN